MSNKIYKSKMKDENRLLGKFVNISLIVLSIIFVLLFLKIIVTEISFHKMIDGMVEGIDYYIEDIIITNKETVEDYYGSESGTTNYFFYYGHDTDKRMQVNKKVYSQYNVGDMFQAYTKDHYYYGATINSVLPKTRYKNNELSKAGIVTIGCLILLLLIYKWIDNLGKKTNNQ